MKLQNKQLFNSCFLIFFYITKYCRTGIFISACVSVVLTLGIGGLIAGIQSKKTGKGFYNGFKNYINENWSQTLGVEMALAIVTIGVTSVAKHMLDCFIAGTLVATGYGLTKIEDIKVGDKVWSYNEKTKQKELKTVKNIFRNKTKSWMHIFVYNKETNKEEEIICTPSHRIYIVNKGWIKAENILAKDKVLLYTNKVGLISKIYKEELTDEQTTYNFEVEDNHNYYVSEEYVLVHNKCLFDPEANSDRYVEYKYKGTNQRAYHQNKGPYKGKYVAYDNATHGHDGYSKFKLFKRVEGKKLQLIGDLDEYGELILKKHSKYLGRKFEIVKG